MVRALSWDGLRAQVADARSELGRVEALHSEARSRVAARVRQLYVGGGFGSVEEVILGARSLSEVLDRLELAERVAHQDAVLVREAVVLRERAVARLAEFEVARGRQAVVVGQRARERRSILEKLTARAQLLASVQTEIARLEEEERARQAVFRRQADESVAALPAVPGRVWRRLRCATLGFRTNGEARARRRVLTAPARPSRVRGARCRATALRGSTV